MQIFFYYLFQNTTKICDFLFQNTTKICIFLFQNTTKTLNLKPAQRLAVSD